MAMTIEQQRALALAAARQRQRAAGATSQAPQEHSWSELPGNIPGSAYNLAAGVGHAAMHPIDTTESINDIAMGGIEKLRPQFLKDFGKWVAPGLQPSPETLQRQEQAANAFGEVMSTRYGSWENIKNTMITDPVGFALDFSMLAGGGAGIAARVPGLAKAAAPLAKVSEFTNPINVVAKPLSKTPLRDSPAIREMRRAAPSLDAVKVMKNAAYDKLDKAGIVYSQREYSGFAMKTMMALRKEGLLAEDSGPIAADLSKIMARTKKINGWTELESLRKSVGNLPAGASKTDQRLAGIIKKNLDDLIENGNPVSLRGLSQQQIAPLVKEARELGRRNILAGRIKDMENKAEWYVSGDESGLRNQAASFGKKGSSGLTELEKKALKKIVRREGPLNVAHMMGSRLANVGLLGLGIGGGVYGGPMGALAPIAGMGANLAFRKGMEAYTSKAVQDALKTFLAGKAAQSKALSLPKPAFNDRFIAPGLLGGQIEQFGQGPR